MTGRYHYTDSPFVHRFSAFGWSVYALSHSNQSQGNNEPVFRCRAGTPRPYSGPQRSIQRRPTYRQGQPGRRRVLQ
ncbi:hypothetical protein METHP14_220011 [Pseudomonas sp. P14-2025]